MAWSAHRGVAAAFGSAILFGISTPLAKLLLGETSPWMLAGLLYLGAGLGLAVWRAAKRAPAVRLPASDRWRFSAAVLSGGVIAPVMLMFGLSQMPATGASLLLNAEAVFTVLLAWVVFREHVTARIALGMLAIVAGALLITVPSSADLGTGWAPLAVLGACFFWALDNNFTRSVTEAHPTWMAMVKGLAAGTTNLLIALALGSRLPSVATSAAALVLGFAAYGVSLTLFVLALRRLGTARAGAYVSVAPFFGAMLAVGLGEPLTASLLAGGALMGVGVWLHVTESHAHEHAHPPLAPGEEPIVHTHHHFPDTEHRHEH